MKRALSGLSVTLAASLCVALGYAFLRPPAAPPAARTPGDPAPTFTPEPLADEQAEPDDELVRPSGAPAAIDCAAARKIVRDVNGNFAGEVKSPEPLLFAELVTSWLDPHGLWSAAVDAPVADLVELEADLLLAELAAPPSSAEPCAAAERLGGVLERWIRELVSEFEAGRDEAPVRSRELAAELALLATFEDGEVTVPARRLSRELGRRTGVAVAAFGAAFQPFGRASRERYLPSLDAAGWARVVLAAALRGYVAALDPHGGWVPLDEEWSLYADDPSFGDQDRLWGDMLRTALGVRIVDRPTPPLEVDDLVLAVDGVATAGLSVEQVEQLARAVPMRGLLGVRSVIVLRQGEQAPREIVIEPAPDTSADFAPSVVDDGEIELAFVPYARGRVAVAAIHFVGDDLGERLAALSEELEREKPLGLLLDLRGNGGGSTDGACAALGVFLPGVPAFPLLRRGRVMEVLVAAEPASLYRGPLAVLVDGETASAAEMLAGAIDRYGRGFVVGARTFGKGCVQEYARDAADAGVLRLTTRLFTLPDGSPVQRVGLVPPLALDLGETLEREADLPGSIEPVSGPDVRRRVPSGPPFPPHRGRLGPCPDPVVCRALGRVSGSSLAAARTDGLARKRRGQR